MDNAFLIEPSWPHVTPSDLARGVAGAVDAAAQQPLEQRTLNGLLEALVERVPELRVAVFGVMRHFVWAFGQHGYAFVPDGFVDDPETASRASVAEIRFVPDVAGSTYVPIDPHAVSALTMPIGPVGDAAGFLLVESVAVLPMEAPALIAPILEPLELLYADAVRGASFDTGALARVLVQISTLRDPRTIAEVAVSALRLALRLDSVQLSLFGTDGVPTLLAGWPGQHPALAERTVAMLRSRIPASAAIEVLPPGAPPRLGVDDAHTIVWLPLRASGTEIGVLTGTSRWLREIGRDRSHAAVLLARHVSASLEATLMLGKERLSALTDPLTGIANRRGFDQRLEAELASAIESGTPLSLLVMDCDDFKEVNDRAGHAFGDALLREAALELEWSVHEHGVAARLGGDEFVVMLLGVDRHEAAARAEEIRRRVASGLADAGFALRMSVGIATCPYDGVGSTQLLRAADQALYRAKEWGKDQIMSFRDIATRAVPVPVEVESADRRRAGPRVESSALADLCNAARLIWAEKTSGAVLERLAKTMSFVVGATGCVVSRIVAGTHLYDVATHALRDTDLGPDWAYLISDFPMTEVVLRERTPRTLSFLDTDIDPAEAYVLRELGMSCVLLVPLIVDDAVLGLVEVYDVRLRRFTAADEAVAAYLADQAGHRLATIGASHEDDLGARPVWRVPRG